MSSLIGCISCLCILTSFNPNNHFTLFASCLVGLAFFSSVYAVLIQSLQMLIITDKNWGISEAACITGFRIGILVAGSGALYLSTVISWEKIYQILAFACMPSLLIIIFFSFDSPTYNASKFSTAFYDFIKKPKLLIITAFMLFYRLQDNFLSVMPGMFLLDIGYSKIQLAFGYKAFGLFAAIIGGFSGGYLCRKYSYNFIFKRVLVCHALSSLLFLFLYYSNRSIVSLYVVVFIQEFTKGLSISPFFSYQLRCCNQEYCITQIALLTSIASITPTFLGSLSGYCATYLGWPCFFIVSGCCFIPAYILVKYLPKI